MKISSKTLFSFVLMLSFAPFVSANTIYNINRTITNGTLFGTASGFIETNDTFGVLSTADILNWQLTLTSSTLNPSSPQFIEMSNPNLFSAAIVGSGLIASATDLSFNFGATDASAILLYSQNEAGTANNFWCLQSQSGNCLGGNQGYEAIGFGTTTGPAAIQFYSGIQSFASVTSPIPEPEIYAMLGIGLGLLGWIGRRKKLIERTAA